jgi:hypothetical protein
MFRFLVILFLVFSNTIIGQVQSDIAIKRDFKADAIMQNVLKSKSKNDIKSALNTYSYKSYSKLLFTAEERLIDGKIDSIFETKEGKSFFVKLDSTNYKFKKEISNQHFFISEKISKHQFEKNKIEKETIIAAKMAGFQEPVYEFIALGLNKTSFYDEIFTLLGTKYVGPLSKSALKNYKFELQDVRYKNDDTVFVISFKSIKRKKSVGLDGELLILKSSYSLINAMVHVKGKVDVQMEQNFSFIDKNQLWFPTSTHILLRKGSSKKSVKTFRKLIGYNFDGTSNVSNKPEDISYIIIQTNIFDIEINQPVSIKKTAYSIEIDKNATDRNSPIWNQFNLKAITKKEAHTYICIDSVVKQKGIERKLNIGRKLLKGFYATKWFDIDLSNVANFNNHEGFRLGFGGITNDNLSKNFRVKGYTAYGFNDKTIKYNFGLEAKLLNDTNTWLGAEYTRDVEEAAKTNLLFEEPNFSLINPRNINISQFYSYKVGALYLHHEVLPNLVTKLQFAYGSYETEFDYTYISSTKLLTRFHMANASFALQWTPNSKYMKTPIGKISVRNASPKITAQITQSFDHIEEADFDFVQLNLKVEHIIKTIKSGSTEFLLKAGFTSGEAPLTHLYNVVPNYSLQNPWRKRINISGTNAFETMTFNEFISDKYVSIQVRQNLENFRIGKKFRPKLSLITRFAIGDIKSPLNHHGVSFKKMNKGYLESGFVLNKLFKGFGISSFYRLGAYQRAHFSDNLAVKITYVLGLGI